MLKTNNDTKTISVNRGDQGKSFDTLEKAQEVYEEIDK